MIVRALGHNVKVGYHIVLVDRRLRPAKTLTPKVRQRLVERIRDEPPARGEVQVLLRKLRKRARLETTLTFD